MENVKYSEILHQNQLMSKEIKGNPYRVKVLSNITINLIKEILEYSLRINQINPVVEIGNYDNIVQDSTKCVDSDLVIIFYNTRNIVDCLSSFFEDIEENDYNSIKERVRGEINIIFQNLKSTPSVIFNLFSSKEFVTSSINKSKIELFVSELNDYLNKNQPNNFNLIDIDKIISQIGTDQSIDLRLFHSSKAPYSLTFFKNYIAAIDPIIFRNTGKLKKAIIFDCDNTLWKGIIGEDGPHKIDMSRTSHNGRIYNAIQQIAVYLSKHGIIVGLCSKNNEQDVSEVFKHHPDIILKDEYIAIKKINWEDKATNLKSIALELNIGLDSLIFVDDSSFEINLINKEIPEIVTLQVPTAIYEYQKQLLKLIYKYFNLSASNEDEKKTELYKQQFLREGFKNKYESIDEYLSSLNILLTIDKDNLSLVQRISQLTQKTNQFNLTTRRYTENQILAFMQNRKDHVFSVSVNDKFGESGVTAVCIMRESQENIQNIFIDTFLMSCRIIGRNIEFVFMDYILDWLINQAYITINAEFIPTQKNDQVEKFYDKLGFVLLNNDDDSKQYSIKTSDYKKKKIDYINVKIGINKPISK